MSGGSLFVIGANHHRVPLEVRERLALGAAEAAALQAELRTVSGLREYALLSTCNRIEFYGVAEHPGVAGQVAAAFCARQRFDAGEFARLALDLRDGDAIRHLVEVSAGLDSQLVGETEIFGQVKEAYAAAQAGGSTGPVLNRVFQKGFQAAKQVRSQTAISDGQVSVANVAVDLAQSIFGRLADTRILLVGAGEIGEKTAKAFQSRGATSLTVASRRIERALELATALGGSAMPFEQRETRLAEFDIVVCATSAPDVVIGLPPTLAAMGQRPARPLFFIDQALPRDVDPGVSSIENVFLYNLDDLARIAEQNRAAREAELGKGRAIAREKAEALWRQVSAQLAGTRGGPDAPG
jgi:glutamyl-tRNA reductase